MRELCVAKEVDVVFVLSSTEYHAEHVVRALRNGKAVFVEKPMALNERDLTLILEVQKQTGGKVMVGYMRRYAAAFVDAIQEIGGLDQISYARVRDIIGQNAFFVNQSGTFPQRYDDIAPADVEEKKKCMDAMVKEALTVDMNVPYVRESEQMWLLLGSLGSHDLSVMREALGMPQKVLGCSLVNNDQFWR